MGIVTVYVVYAAVSVVLTVIVAATLARSGRVFLTEVFQGNEPLGRAVNRLLVVGFCLLNLGFLTLAMRSSTQVEGARQAINLLSVKLGEVCLIVGVLHSINVFAFTRFRRRARSLQRPEWRPARAEDPGRQGPGRPSQSSASQSSASQSSAGQSSAGQAGPGQGSSGHGRPGPEASSPA